MWYREQISTFDNLIILIDEASYGTLTWTYKFGTRRLVADQE